jgi:hypothetical protein
MITRQDLMTLEAYAAARPNRRQDALLRRRDRQVELGAHVTLCFEDRETVLYQIQEMLHIERTFEPEGIQDELAAYTPLIPTGTNLKATMMIEYSDSEERAQRLQELVGIESRVYVEIHGRHRVYAVADEDLDRATPDKTSAVHFLRFELPAAMRQALAHGSELIVGVDHARYSRSALLTMERRHELIKDLDEVAAMAAMA